MSKLIVLSGVPGSGKSYFSNMLKKMRRRHVYIVSSDGLRKDILGDVKDVSEEDLIWKTFYGLAKLYAKDKNAFVILDATHIYSQKRKEIVNEFKNLYDEVVLVTFNLDKELVKHQNIEREYPVPLDVLNMFYECFEYPDEEEKRLFDKVYVIDTSDIGSVIYDLLEK